MKKINVEKIINIVFVISILAVTFGNIDYNTTSYTVNREEKKADSTKTYNFSHENVEVPDYKANSFWDAVLKSRIEALSYEYGPSYSIYPNPSRGDINTEYYYTEFDRNDFYLRVSLIEKTKGELDNADIEYKPANKDLNYYVDIFSDDILDTLTLEHVEDDFNNYLNTISDKNGTRQQATKGEIASEWDEYLFYFTGVTKASSRGILRSSTEYYPVIDNKPYTIHDNFFLFNRGAPSGYYRIFGDIIRYGTYEEAWKNILNFNEDTPVAAIGKINLLESTGYLGKCSNPLVESHYIKNNEYIACSEGDYKSDYDYKYISHLKFYSKRRIYDKINNDGKLSYVNDIKNAYNKGGENVKKIKETIYNNFKETFENDNKNIVILSKDEMKELTGKEKMTNLTSEEIEKIVTYNDGEILRKILKGNKISISEYKKNNYYFLIEPVFKSYAVDRIEDDYYNEEYRNVYITELGTFADYVNSTVDGDLGFLGAHPGLSGRMPNVIYLNKYFMCDTYEITDRDDLNLVTVDVDGVHFNFANLYDQACFDYNYVNYPTEINNIIGGYPDIKYDYMYARIIKTISDTDFKKYFFDNKTSYSDTNLPEQAEKLKECNNEKLNGFYNNSKMIDYLFSNIKLDSKTNIAKIELPQNEFECVKYGSKVKLVDEHSPLFNGVGADQQGIDFEGFSNTKVIDKYFLARLYIFNNLFEQIKEKGYIDKFGNKKTYTEYVDDINEEKVKKMMLNSTYEQSGVYYHYGIKPETYDLLKFINSYGYSVNILGKDILGGGNYIFRIIDTKHPFPGSSGNEKDTRSNWDECEVNNYIKDANDSYNKTGSGAMYTIKLTPTDIKKIQSQDYDYGNDDKTAIDAFMNYLKGEDGSTITNKLKINDSLIEAKKALTCS